MLIDLFTLFGQNIRVLDYNFPEIAVSQRILTCLLEHPLSQCQAVSICGSNFSREQPNKVNMGLFLNITTFPNVEVIALENMELTHCFNVKDLIKLSLYNVTVYDGFWEEFLSNFSMRLRVLRLSHMKLSDAHIIPVLKKGRFTELDLSYTLITDKTLFTIAKTQTDLVSVNLYETIVTPTGLAALADLTKLQTITVRDLQKFSTRNPNFSNYYSWEWQDLDEEEKRRPKSLKEVSSLRGYNPSVF